MIYFSEEPKLSEGEYTTEKTYFTLSEVYKYSTVHANRLQFHFSQTSFMTFIICDTRRAAWLMIFDPLMVSLTLNMLSFSLSYVIVNYISLGSNFILCLIG